VKNFCGQLELGESAALLKRCGAAIGGDHGALHLATAVGTPVVALFGKGEPSARGPLLPGSLALKSSAGRMDDLPPGTVLRGLCSVIAGTRETGLKGAQSWPGREAEGPRIEAAWRSTTGASWLARQRRVDGAVPLREIAGELVARSLAGTQRLEGPELAAVHADLCRDLSVFRDERP
jgi:hypothetical protein